MLRSLIFCNFVVPYQGFSWYLQWPTVCQALLTCARLRFCGICSSKPYMDGFKLPAVSRQSARPFSPLGFVYGMARRKLSVFRFQLTAPGFRYRMLRFRRFSQPCCLQTLLYISAYRLDICIFPRSRNHCSSG